jgi:hypothetical protein
VELDDDVEDWLFAACAWWLRAFGPIEEATLVVPTGEHFPGGQPEDLLEAVIEHAGMQGWSFELVDESDLVMDDPMPNVPRPAFPAAVLAPEDDAEPIPEGGPFPIPYTGDDAADPVALVAVLARGVSHYLLATAEDDPPDGDEHREALVELGAVLLGFGVFVANSAFRFQKFDDGGVHGWNASAQGELGEDALGYLLAVFVELTGADERTALAHLRPNPKAAFQAARRRLRGPRADDLARLRAVVPVSTSAGPYR